MKFANLVKKDLQLRSSSCRGDGMWQTCHVCVKTSKKSNGNENMFEYSFKSSLKVHRWALEMRKSVKVWKSGRKKLCNKWDLDWNERPTESWSKLKDDKDERLDPAL